MDELKEIALNQIKTKNNYRKTFRDKSLKELAQSIKENGVLEPVIVRQNGTGFELIAGERRVRAAFLANVATVPAIVKEISDRDILKIQMIENIQREDVPFMEEAYGLRDLRDKCDLDTSELAKMVGKSDFYVFVMLKMTEMHAEAQEAARKGELLKSVVFHIAKLKNKELQGIAARDLRRSKKDKLITESCARKYIKTNFSEQGLLQRRRTKIQKSYGNDFSANWKKYLLTFNCQQFEYFKAIARGRTDVPTLSEAVEQVMLENKK